MNDTSQYVLRELTTLAMNSDHALCQSQLIVDSVEFLLTEKSIYREIDLIKI